MKKIFMFFIVLTVSSVLHGQTKVGQVSFLLGTVQYSVDGTNDWKSLDVGVDVLSNWVLRTIDDAELEITWDNGEVSELSGLSSAKVVNLMKDANLETDWLDKMKNKIDVMFKENEASKVQGVAGIRRSEVTIEKEDSIYWAKPKVADFAEGYAAFKNNDYQKSIKILEEVVSQDPLSKKGEISRSCLITMYTKLGNKEKAEEHRQLFLRDFPDSELLSIITESN